MKITMRKMDFDCPKCTYHHTEDDYNYKSKYITCKGCKTKLGFTDDIKGNIVVWLKEDEKRLPKNPKKPKCYVIMVARSFLKTHSRSGEPTFFIEKIAEGMKVHTVRGNYKLWKKRIEKVLKGEAYISLRYWDGKPFVSKQVEFKILFAADGVGIEAVEKRTDGMIWHYTEEVDLFDFVPLKPIGNKNLDFAKNDGLSLEDLQDWFKKAKTNEPLALIYFSTFRY